MKYRATVLMVLLAAAALLLAPGEARLLRGAQPDLHANGRALTSSSGAIGYLPGLRKLLQDTEDWWEATLNTNAASEKAQENSEEQLADIADDEDGRRKLLQNEVEYAEATEDVDPASEAAEKKSTEQLDQVDEETEGR